MPPAGVIVAVPLAPALQLTLVLVADAVSKVFLKILNSKPMPVSNSENVLSESKVVVLRKVTLKSLKEVCAVFTDDMLFEAIQS